ncbi:MAG: hypothetical protein M3T55_02660 [Pseudomonadota bacterium]|nr:hypothetical protein [Pseudomonadota bacterium]
MAKQPELRTIAKATTASKRPKTVTVKTLSTNGGPKTRVFALDANSASFGDDFLYAFKSNVQLARRKSKERSAATDVAELIA